MPSVDAIALAGWKFLFSIIVSAGGGAAIAVAICKKYGDKWLDAHFAKRLEALKHEQAKEIEGIRQRVQWHFSRVSKIHEKEFDVLPHAWLLLHDAHGRSGALVAPIKEVHELRHLEEERYLEFVAKTSFTAYYKDELRKAAPADRQKVYNDAMARHELSEAEKAQREFNNYLIEHRIFMTKTLAEGFREASLELALVNNNYKSYIQFGTAQPMAEAITRFGNMAQFTFKIEGMIQDRLHCEQA